MHETKHALVFTCQRLDRFKLQSEGFPFLPNECNFEPMEPLTCKNQCVFCFVHQNPKNVRRSLYIKDEDFRLSFLFGNYLTLTNVHEAEMQRIIEQRLSPLYISVHATEPELRRRLLGIEEYDGILEKIAR